jgi:hypothetical protein
VFVLAAIVFSEESAFAAKGRVHSRQPDVLVSSSLSPWLYEVRMIRRMRRLCVWRLGRWLPVVQEVRRLCVWRLEADVSNREKMRLVPAWRAIFALRTALHDWLLAIVSKCMFILPLVDSILKRG